MSDGDQILEQKLREEASYIDDDGFTARVVAQLPVRPRRNRSRAFVLLAMAALAAVVAYQITEGGRFVWVAVAYLQMVPIWLVFGALFLLAVTVTAFGLATALSHERRT